nr:hypothetical protein CFP56_63286 [Quercus suber]
MPILSSTLSLVLDSYCESNAHEDVYPKNRIIDSLIKSERLRKLLAESSEEAAIPSPLTPLLAISSGKGEDQNQKAVSKPSTVQAVLKGIKQSCVIIRAVEMIMLLLR